MRRSHRPGLPAGARSTAGWAVASETRHGLSVFGDLKYPRGFEHFEYVNPDAPKGGTLRLSAAGTFYNLQPFIRQGGAAIGLTELIYDTLPTRAWDEPSALYGLLAETVELAEDKRWIEFVLRPEARWHDGEPVTADDVVFTIETLKEKGSPRWKTLLLAVIGSEQLDPHRVRIHLSEQATRQLPLQIVSGIQILPEHYWATRKFDKTTLEPLLASGPYRVGRVDPGRSISYERVPDYWGKNLAVNVGRFNFDRIQYKYFAHNRMQGEAVKGRDVDFLYEFVAKIWASAYEIPAKHRGDLVQKVFQTDQPIRNFLRAFNLRRKKFQDPRVREALLRAYDFQWAKRVVYFDEFGRSRSFFQNSDMEHRGPPSREELALLEPFRDELDPRVFQRQWDPPIAPGYGRNRASLLVADRLLRAAGWIVREGVRVNAETGEPFEIEFLMTVPGQKTSSLIYADSLKQLGIRMRSRAPYTAEYQNLVRVEREFDMTTTTTLMRLVPDAELRNVFGSRSADRPYSANTPGIKSPAIDSLIEKVIGAGSRAEMVIAARALDRVICWSFYFADYGHLAGSRYVYWNIFGKPKLQPRFATGFPFTWWIDAAKAEKLLRPALHLPGRAEKLCSAGSR